MIGERWFRKRVLCKTFVLPMNILAAGDLFGTRKGGKERFWGHPTRSGRGAQRQDAKKPPEGGLEGRGRLLIRADGAGPRGGPARRRAS